MSQIPRSQFTLKKHKDQVPMAPMQVLDLGEHQNGTKTKKTQNGNGHKSDAFESNEVVIVDNTFLSIVDDEIVIVGEEPPQFEDISPSKKKRHRRSKDSTESRESDVSKKNGDSAKSNGEPAKPHEKKSPQKAPQKQTQEQKLPEVAAPQTPVKESKIPKLISDSARRSDRLQNASTIVNLSTISTTERIEETFDMTPAAVPDRRVSGRRSTRPIDDIKMSYRTPRVDESFNATTNATIGSDLPNDSMLTTPGSIRKRPIEASENVESPKRSRMDLSGLFSSFASPVTLLRNRFTGASIASTPIVGRDPINDSADVDELEQIDLSETPKMAEEAKEEELKVIVTPIKKRQCAIM